MGGQLLSPLMAIYESLRRVIGGLKPADPQDTK
jgi:hypothetical protein